MESHWGFSPEKDKIWHFNRIKLAATYKEALVEEEASQKTTVLIHMRDDGDLDQNGGRGSGKKFLDFGKNVDGCVSRITD